jgi:Tol biopolymer transport system component
MKLKFSKRVCLSIAILAFASLALAQTKPKLTLDEFFNSVSYPTVAISPDGNSVALVTERADWDQQIFRDDLWLYREDAKPGSTGSLIQLTQSGHDTQPKWSPDARWIAFLSERKSASSKDSDSADEKGKNKNKDEKDKETPAQIYLISPAGGEAIALTQGEEDIHSFTWSADGHTIYYSTRTPRSKAQKDVYKKQWKDVVQYRTAERGDTIFALEVAAALAHHAAAPTKESADAESDQTPGASPIAISPLRVEDLEASPDGSKLAFASNSINQRQETNEDVEIYILDLKNDLKKDGVGAGDPPALAGTTPVVAPRQLTHNQALESHLHWSSDNRHILFTVENGDVTGPYRDLQTHVYQIDSDTGAVEQWAKDFPGHIEHYTVTNDGILTSARLGTEVPVYQGVHPNHAFHKVKAWDGTYENLSATALLRVWPSSTPRCKSPKRSTWPMGPTKSTGPAPSLPSTRRWRKAIFPRANPTPGKLTTAPPSKVC